MKVEDFVRLVGEFDEKFIPEDYLKVNFFKSYTGKEILNTECFNIIGEVKEREVSVQEIRGRILPENLEDRTWRLLAEQLGHGCSAPRYSFIVGLKKFPRKKMQYKEAGTDFRYAALGTLVGSPIIDADIGPALYTVNDISKRLTKTINKEMERLVNLSRTA